MDRNTQKLTQELSLEKDTLIFMGEGVFFSEFSLNIFFCLINVNMKITASYIYNKCMHNIFSV
jgi:hypothetical protein